eukprot:CAMPEP_0118648720 /NCGR_PEP_ID=MMETSP0785-20121206/9311_1 /TAXON_ID=91992 /ORGANISM="Bolidomonas pacifica, Strain CCMP 1866" /LENGTH=257 /DNA_ID=CAMNT_0006540941 /DNA_START=133 /DNA_END=903 /DNA_ORIENTATION=+
MIPLHTAPSKPTSPYSMFLARLSPWLIMLRSRFTDLKTSVRTFDYKNFDYVDFLKTTYKNTKSLLANGFLPFLYDNIFACISVFLILLGCYLNYMSAWSITLSCSHTHSTNIGSCTMLVSGTKYLELHPRIAEFPTVNLGEARTARLALTPDKYETTLGNVVQPEGLSRKRKRALRYGYIASYDKGEGKGVKEVVMGKTGIGRKRSAEKVKRINRFRDNVQRGKDGNSNRISNPDVVELDIQEGRSVCVSGIFCIIA